MSGARRAEGRGQGAAYPTMNQVEEADIVQLCRWYRFLPASTDAGEQLVMKRICERTVELGGFTAEISKQIGWDYNLPSCEEFDKQIKREP